MAVVTFTNQYRHYLLGSRFTLRSDHSALQWVRNFKEPRGQLARWLEHLGQFDFDLIHRAGKKHQNADALSRADLAQEGKQPNPHEWEEFHEEVDNVEDLTPSRPLELVPKVEVRMITRAQRRKLKEKKLAEEKEALEKRNGDRELTVLNGDTGVPVKTAEVAVPELDEVAEHSEFKLPTDEELGNLEEKFVLENADTLREAQAADPESRSLLDWLKHSGWPEKNELDAQSPSLKNYISLKRELFIRDGVLFLRNQREEGVAESFRLVVPRNLRSQILELYHNSIYGGHMGVEKTYDRVRKKFHWYAMKKDVRIYIQKCLACEEHKRAGRKAKFPLSHYVVGYPLDRVGMDILGPFPITGRGNKYVLVIGDYFTKWMEAYALPDQTAETVATRFVNEFVARLGVPLKMTSDQGRNFVSEIMVNVCQLLGVDKARTTPYRPQSNGLVERFNGTILKMLRAYVSYKPTEWDEYLPLLTAAYRATPHSATGFSPNYLMLGREVSIPMDLAYPLLPREFVTTTGYAQEMEEALYEAYGRVRKSLKVAAERQKRLYDTAIVENVYEKGDVVYMLNAVKTHKLSPAWEGPFVVLQPKGGPLYLIRGSRRSLVAHQDRLKAYRPEKLPNWAKKIQRELKKTQEGGQEAED